MAFFKIKGAIFEEQNGKLNAVSDPQTLRDIKSGKIQTEERATTKGVKFTEPEGVTQTGDTSTSLVDFSSTLDQVTQLARSKRQKMVKSILGREFEPGALSASDFGSILSSVESAGREFGEEAVERFLPEPEEEPKLTGDIAQFRQAQELGLIDPEKTDFFDFIKKRGEAKREPEEPEPTGLEEIKTTDLKSRAREMLGSFSSRVITELNDEQLREFMIDLEETQSELQQSLDPETFLKEWKKATGVGQEGLVNPFE